MRRLLAALLLVALPAFGADGFVRPSSECPHNGTAAANTPIPIGLVATAVNGWAINCAGATPRVVARGIFDTP